MQSNYFQRCRCDYCGWDTEEGTVGNQCPQCHKGILIRVKRT